jgi:uncharacterized membrane protein YccC
MAKNVGSVDRIVRILLAILFAVLYFRHTVPGVLGIVLLIVGIVLFITALAGSCPAYSMFGISTCKREGS